MRRPSARCVASRARSLTAPLLLWLLYVLWPHLLWLYSLTVATLSMATLSMATLYLPGEIAAGAPLMPLAAASEEWAAALAPRLAAGDTYSGLGLGLGLGLAPIQSLAPRLAAGDTWFQA
jgi:hypothetical protein